MTEKDVNRYLYLVNRRLELFMSGTDWKPEYEQELEEIEKELAELESIVNQARKVSDQKKREEPVMTEKVADRYLYLMYQRIELLMLDADHGSEYEPEYEREMYAIERELGELEPIINQARRDFCRGKKEGIDCVYES